MSRFISICFTVVLLAPAAIAAPAYDLVLRNGQVIDGTGKPAFRADVGIKDGRIAIIGEIPAGAGASEIDVGGKAIAPGFIDVHTHVDSDIHKSPAAENFIRDGVTTIICGNCGGSVTNVGAYLARIGKQGAGVNVATLYGHNTVLRAVKGDRKGELTPEQLEKARGLVRKAMQEGAVGFSTGLIYNPGQFSTTEEIIELAKPAGEVGGIYASHMRSEGTSIIAAIDEATRIGREAKMRVEISHFKLPADTAKKLGGADATLGRVAEARAKGADVWLDQYPYTASSTSISTLIPDTLLEDGIEKARQRVQDSTEFEKALATMVARQKKIGHSDLSYVVIAHTSAFPKYNGRNIRQIAEMRAGRENGGELLKDNNGANPGKAADAKIPSIEAQCRAVLEIFKAGNAQCVFHTMNDTEVEKIMASPLVAVASDSGLREFGVGVPHPRGYGTNSRVLGRYAREKKIISMEEAVRKMTSMPAATFRFADRGQVKVGFAADLTIFDPKTVIDRATFEQPHQYPEGITDVIVNGVPVLRDGKLTGKLSGKPIYGPGKAAEKKS
jgi:N-acyl-D-amino-acid deacylase